MATHSSDVSPTPPTFVSSAKGAVCLIIQAINEVVLAQY